MKPIDQSAPKRARFGAVALLLSFAFGGCASVSEIQNESWTPCKDSQVFAGCGSQAGSAGSVASANVRASQPADTTASRSPAATSAAAAAAIASGRAMADAATGAAPPADRASRLVHEGSLWDRIRAGFAMPELNTPLVAEKERFYLAKPEYLQRMFLRGSRYMFFIVEELEKRGMPTELALLPFVESAMNPVALSPAQAAGLWQFIPSTGKAYDLDQNWWVDNRRDVVKSTLAALDYLQKIYEMHGDDWFLALASYNWGENAVARAVKKNQARGRPTDYLSLDMPAETRHYVPKLIALKHIVQNAQQLGIVLPTMPNKPYFVTIEKTRPIDLKLAAQFAGMSVEEFVALNPAHNRPVIAASRNNQIKIPADRVVAFTDAVEKHEAAKKAFATWQPYTLKSGETLDTLAQRSGVSTAELRKANDLKDGQRIIAGTRILAPQRAVEDEMTVEAFVAPRVYEQVDRPPVYHTVGKKDSLASISSRYGVSAATLAAWNGIKQGLQRGMRLLVQPAATQTLLTNEEGQRSVVASEARAPAAVRVAARDEAPGAGDSADAAPTPQTKASVRQVGPTSKSPAAHARAPAPRSIVKVSTGAPARSAAPAAARVAPAAKSPRPAAPRDAGRTAQRVAASGGRPGA